MAQTVIGQRCVLPFTGQEYIYSIFGDITGGTRQTYKWCVSGGVIRNPNLSNYVGNCYQDVNVISTTLLVRWTQPGHTGSITVFSNAGSTTIPITIGYEQAISVQQPSYSYGSTQILVNGNDPFGGTTCEGTSSIKYQWESAPAADGPYTAIENEVSQNYTLGVPLTQNIFLRRLITQNNGIFFGINPIQDYSNVVELHIPELNPGAISILQNPNYNEAAQISSTPATGGYCYTADYMYEWQISVEGGPWQSIGNSETYPVNAPPMVGKTAIRRKITCGSQTLYTNVLIVTPIYTSPNSENMNYVRSNTINIKNIRSWYQADQLATGDKIQSTVYLDGFGRVLQTVGKEISPGPGDTWNDIVKPFEYDEAGRTTKSFLAYTSSSYPGKYKPAALTEQPVFIQGFFDEPEDAPTYDVIEFEDNPLDRVTKTMRPGHEWAGSSRGNSIQYDYNDAGEKVHIWALDYTDNAIPVSGADAVYLTGSLTKTKNIDERRNMVITYTDLSGKVILKKIRENEEEDQLSNEHDGWACTYYVYDDLGSLRYVITPKAVEYLDHNSWALSQNIADELCYKYVYDARGRLIVKKQPGVGAITMIYDRRDRLVFSQDANQAAKSPGEWLVNFYDEKDRGIITALYRTTSSKTDLQTTANNSLTAGTITTTMAAIKEGLVVEQRDAAIERYTAKNKIEFVSGFISGDADKFETLIDANALGGTDQTVIVYGNPVPAIDISDPAKFMPLTFNYYDDYTYAGAKSFNSSYSFAYNPGENNTEAAIVTQRTTSMVTGSRARVLDNDGDPLNDKFLLTTVFYDELGRTLQTQSDNNKQGVDTRTGLYDFSGKLWSSYLKHTASNFPVITAITKNEFDKTGRLIHLSKNFNNTIYKQLAEYTYDELGELKSKRLAPGYTGTGKNEIEQLEYSYNIQGWLTGINKNYALGNDVYAQWDHYFGLYLGYAYTNNEYFNSVQYNGSITGVIWKSQGDNTPRKYDYLYDYLGRLASAGFTQKSKPGGEGWNNADVDFSTEISYADKNSNLLSMSHRGTVPGRSTPLYVDGLTYAYKPIDGAGNLTGNKLVKVTDDLNDLALKNGSLGDFKDGANVGDDYTYDDNGNITADQNKNIIPSGNEQGITYNFLNKPQKIVIQDKSTIEFTYDATGEKLEKKVMYSNGDKRITRYVNEFIYEEFTPSSGSGTGEALQYVLHEEGRLKIIQPESNNDYEVNAGTSGINWPGETGGVLQGVFEYFIKDNLGSTRMVLTEEHQVEKYHATMEDDGNSNKEEKLFGAVLANGEPDPAINEVRVTRTPTPNTPWTENGSAYVSKLSAGLNGKKIGPNMILKVMAGDIISAKTNYYYQSNNPGGETNPVSDMLTSLLNSLTGKTTDVIGKYGVDVQSTLNNNIPFNDFIKNKTNDVPNAPRAYLRIIFLDEQLKFIDKDMSNPGIGSEILQVSEAGNQHASPLMLQQKAPKNGWVFVYVSNESNENVYFDNLAISQEHSAISEENHYYPFGQKIAGISSRAFNKLANKYGYQGDFSEEEEETGWDEFDLRMYNPQIGRWNGIDPKDQFESGYIGMANNPIINIDKDGGWSFGYTGSVIGALAGATAAYLIIKNNAQMDGIFKVLIGAGLTIFGAGLGYSAFESLNNNPQGYNLFGDGTEGQKWRNVSPHFFDNFKAFYAGIAQQAEMTSRWGENNVQATPPNFKINLPNFNIIFPKISITIKFVRILPYWNLFNKGEEIDNYSMFGDFYRTMFIIPNIFAVYWYYELLREVIIRKPVIRIRIRNQ